MSYFKRVVIPSIIASALVFIILYTGITFMMKLEAEAEPQPQTEYELFYMYGGPKGTYWLEPTAEYENIIYVDHASLEEWGIAPSKMGEKYIGTFDPTGWDLLKIEKKEGK